MATLINSQTGQSVTFEDATNFLAEISDPENWVLASDEAPSIEVAIEASSDADAAVEAKPAKKGKK